MRQRVIPCLLLHKRGFYKTTRFANPRYVGDPINTVRIFNDKEVDEITILDIEAPRTGTSPDFASIANLASECFMPLCYGGGLRSMEDLHRLFDIGVEKASLNSAAIENPSLIEQAAEIFGSQSIVVSIDVKQPRLGEARVVGKAGTKSTRLKPVEHARAMQERGAGEIILTSVDREGTGNGYDLDLVREVSGALSIPVIANGGAGTLEHIVEAFRHGASAAAAGSLFVFQGKHRAVLITYPTENERSDLFRELNADVTANDG